MAFSLWTQHLFPLGWAHYLAGGLLIGLGVSALFVFTGWVGGMSSVFTSTWSYVSQRPFFQQARSTESRVWRMVFALGLVVGAGIWWLALGPSAAMQTSIGLWQLGVGGVLVGFGARLGVGNTPLLVALVGIALGAYAKGWLRDTQSKRS